MKLKEYVERKFHPRTGHEGIHMEYIYSSTRSLSSALDGSGWLTSRPGRFTPGRPGTHCTGGWLGARSGLDRREKSHPTGIQSPDRPARNQSLHRLSYLGPVPHCISQKYDSETVYWI